MFQRKTVLTLNLREPFFLNHFQLEQTYPLSLRLQFKSFCLPHVHVWTLTNRTLFYRESRSVTSVSPNQHRKHFPAVQSEILLQNLYTVLSGLNIFSSKPTSILHFYWCNAVKHFEPEKLDSMNHHVWTLMGNFSLSWKILSFRLKYHKFL